MEDLNCFDKIYSNHIVHGDYKMILAETGEYKGLNFEIFEPDYNEVQQREMDNYIIAGLSRLLNDHNNKNAE